MKIFSVVKLDPHPTSQDFNFNELENTLPKVAFAKV